jgi:hypothetical protein
LEYWSSGVMEYWFSSEFITPLLQHSITPVL